MKYKLSHFNYSLPETRIAKKPAKHRDEAKLLVVDRKTEKIEHKKIKDLIEYFKNGDVIALNNTKVFPARLYANKEKTGAKIEVFLLRELNKKNRLWDVLVDPARKIRIGNKLFFGENYELIAANHSISLKWGDWCLLYHLIADMHLYHIHWMVLQIK